MNSDAYIIAVLIAIAALTPLTYAALLGAALYTAGVFAMEAGWWK